MGSNSKAHRTLWNRRYRSNVESGLQINQPGDRYVFATNTPFDLGTADWSFSFFFQQDAAPVLDPYHFTLQGTSSLRKLICRATNRLLRVTADPDATGQKEAILNAKNYPVDAWIHAVIIRRGLDSEIWQNGQMISKEVAFYDVADAFTVDEELWLGIRTNLGNELNGLMAHWCGFNRALLAQEIQFIHKNGGLLPESCHPNCVAHYPLTQRYGFKADAAFVAKHPQFIVGDNVTFDVVEQYNYAKVTPLTANHAELVGYTDTELGIPNPSSQEVFKDFYFKSDLQPWGIKGDANGYARKTNIVNLVLPEQNWGFILEYAKLEDLNNQVFFDTRNASSQAYLRFTSNINGLKIFVQTENGAAELVDLDYEYDLLSNLNVTRRIYFEKTDNNPNNWNLYVDGIKLSATTINGSHNVSPNFPIRKIALLRNEASPSNRTRTLVADAKFLNSLLTDSERREYFQSNILPDAKIEESIDFQKKSGLTMPTKLGNDLTLFDFPNDQDYIYQEKKSLLPEIEQGLLMETGISIGETYTSIVGVGFTIQVLTDIAAITDIITGLPAITAYFVNGVKLANVTELLDTINLNELCHVDLEFASSTPTITFIHTGDDYNLIRDYYLNDQLTLREKKEITNNILFSNPDSVIQSKFNYYALHNEGNYIAGATNPENVPLIDVDAIGNRESLGWTGGDAATKLIDLVSNLDEIDELR